MTDTRNFNSRTYTRCDFFHTVDGGNPANFNSRTYTRCDSRLKQIMDEKNNFNSRTYTRCDKIPPSRKNLNPKFQFTHLHEVRPYELDELSKSIMISIHAPTRGATVTIRDYNADTTISIHAPTRGATCNDGFVKWIVSTFQFTHLHEVRRVNNDFFKFIGEFQFTHLHEVRRFWASHRQGSYRFQFTHLHEVRRISPAGKYRRQTISIHAPTRGATAPQKIPSAKPQTHIILRTTK